MSTTPRTEALALSGLRSSRQSLRIERARVVHWRRLLRARIDLAVAVAVLPEALGQDEWGVLPMGAERDLPPASELIDAVRRANPSDLDQLGDLLILDRRLASYESTVDQALDGTTDEFIRRLALNPAASLQAPPTLSTLHSLQNQLDIT